MPLPPPRPPYSLASLVDVMAALRDPQHGCPWDLQQDFATIAPYTIEEAYEVADAIARGDMNDLRDELGDLLLQIAYHARMAEEASSFALCDVISAICDKMIRRHPHVFADATVRSAEAQNVSWEEAKARERSHTNTNGALAGVAAALPALLRAQKLQGRAARVGFDWPDASGPRRKIDEELAEVARAMAGDGCVEDEIGDLLFSVVNWARHLGVDAETALRSANARFTSRFETVERLADGADLSSLTIAQLEQLWQRAKGLAAV